MARNFPGVLGGALWCASLSCSFSAVALGQSQAETAEPESAPAAATADQAPAVAPATEAPQKPEDAQVAEGANAKSPAAAADASPPVPLAPPPPTPKQEQAAALLSLPFLVVEQLPNSAYPEPRTRGLRGGSLWLTMHGYQFPYMPAAAGMSPLSIALSGSAWVDTSYREVDSGLAAQTGDANLNDWRQQGRFVGRITSTYDASGGWFAQAQGELVLNGASDTTVAMHAENTDDLLVRIGNWDWVDLTAGRFQGWEIYHFGMGLDQNTLERDGARTDQNKPPGIYGVTYLWDRMDGPGKLALHFYPTDYLRFEVQGVVGSNVDNQLGVRPVGIFDLGWVKLKAGVEYEKQTPRARSRSYRRRTVNRGAGASLQFVVDPYVEFGVNAAQGLADNYNNFGVLDASLSETRSSLGGFVNGRIYGPLLVGAGVNSTRKNNLKVNATTGQHDVFTHLQSFGAIQYMLFDGFYVKLVAAYADAHFNMLSDDAAQRQNYRNKALSGRLRLMVLF